MAARSTWRGAIDFAGFPVNVAAYPLVKSRNGESFKLLTPDGKPVEQFYREVGNEDGELYKISDLGRGVETEQGLKQIPTEALEQISEMERSQIVEARYFAPIDSIPMELVESAYSIVPDSKVPGSDRSVNVLWNGLRAKNLAYVTQVTMRSGSKDSILVVYPTDFGLVAVTLPFADDLHGAQPVTVTPDEKAAKTIARFISAKDVKKFSFDDFQSESRDLRKKAVEAALSGKPIKAKTKPKKADVKDLMAALEAQLQEA